MRPKTVARAGAFALWVCAISLALPGATLRASEFRQAQKALTNADVIRMVKSGLPESTIVGAIQANDTDFDVSADGLIELQKADVPQKVSEAMLAAAAAKRGQSAGGRAAADGSPSTPGGPTATLVNGGSKVTVPGEKTQLAQTKTKASSLGGLASDSALNQAFRAGVNVASWEVLERSGSYAGYTAAQQAGNTVSAILGSRKPTVTYVWALPSPASTTVAPSNTPSFEVNFGGVPGILADDYEPAIVKLTRSQSSWRLVGATQGKADAMQNTSPDWRVYSSFVEDRVAVQTRKIATGQVQISPTRPLAPGEYGVVLRPISKDTKFSGADVARNQGAGLLFNSVWSFQVN